MKQGILVVSFGTRIREAREKTTDKLQAEMKARFPNLVCAGAYTSDVVAAAIREQGEEALSPEEALRRMLEQGVTHLAVQPLYVVRGAEYRRLQVLLSSYQDQFIQLRCGEPLLTNQEDYKRTVQALRSSLKPLCGERGLLVLMGHGSEHTADFSYERLQMACEEAGWTNVLVGTMEGARSLDRIWKTIEQKAFDRIVLAPLLVGAGIHVRREMDGAEDSWKNRLEQAGFSVVSICKGLGEYDEIRRIYADHAAAALEQEQSLVPDQKEADPGILYGIGIGPGDPELLTLKAVRLIRACDVLVVPGQDYRSSIAWQIARRAVPEMEQTPCIGVEIPMTRDRQVREEHHRKAAKLLISLLRAGKQVGFLNLGDVTLYASYLYIHRLVQAEGFQAELVNGIPSFCAAAAALNMGLVEDTEQLHVLSHPSQLAEGLKLSGTRVIMKTGKQMPAVKEQLRQMGARAFMVENCGMPGQQISMSLDEIREDAGYYSLLIVKEGDRDR